MRAAAGSFGVNSDSGKWPIFARATVMLLATCVGNIVYAQTSDPVAPAPEEIPPAKAPTWRDKLSHGFSVHIQMPAPKTPPPVNEEATGMNDQDVLNRIFQRSDGGSSMKVRDITQVSSQADVVLDLTCMEIVQPFGKLDSAASLAVFATKLALLRKLGVGPQTSSADLIRMAASQLNWLSVSTEQRIGERMLASSADMILDEDRNGASKLIYENARKTLAQVLAQIHEPIPYQFQIIVIKVNQGNAASLPGGTILVDEDLFARDWDPSVAYFKVAHEVSHVLQRHQTRMYQARLVDGITTAGDLRKFVATANNQPAGIVGRIVGLKHLMVEFTASQELQADACAVRLARSNFAEADLVGMQQAIIESLGPIESVSSTPAAPSPHLSSLVDGQFERHPNTSERRKNLDAMFATRD